MCSPLCADGGPRVDACNRPANPHGLCTAFNCGLKRRRCRFSFALVRSRLNIPAHSQRGAVTSMSDRLQSLRLFPTFVHHDRRSAMIAYPHHPTRSLHQNLSPLNCPTLSPLFDGCTLLLLLLISGRISQKFLTVPWINLIDCVCDFDTSIASVFNSDDEPDN